MTPDSDQPVTFTLSKTHFMVSFGKTRVYSPLILGEYINYKQILPTSWTTAVRADRRALLSSVDRASIVARDGSNKYNSPLRIRCSPSPPMRSGLKPQSRWRLTLTATSQHRLAPLPQRRDQEH